MKKYAWIVAVVIIAIVIIVFVSPRTIACTNCGKTKQCHRYRVETIYGTKETWWLCDSCYDWLKLWN